MSYIICSFLLFFFFFSFPNRPSPPPRKKARCARVYFAIFSHGCRIRGFVRIPEDSADGPPRPEYHECARGVLNIMNILNAFVIFKTLFCVLDIPNSRIQDGWARGGGRPERTRIQDIQDARAAS